MKINTNKILSYGSSFVLGGLAAHVYKNYVEPKCETKMEKVVTQLGCCAVSYKMALDINDQLNKLAILSALAESATEN